MHKNEIERSRKDVHSHFGQEGWGFQNILPIPRFYRGFCVLCVRVHSTIDSKAHGTGLETAIFYTPMRVAPDVISQHFRTNMLHAILVPKNIILSKTEQEVMDKIYAA